MYMCPQTRDLRTQTFRAVNLGWVSGSKALFPAHQLYRRLTSYPPCHLMVPEAVKKVSRFAYLSEMPKLDAGSSTFNGRNALDMYVHRLL